MVHSVCKKIIENELLVRTYFLLTKIMCIVLSFCALFSSVTKAAFWAFITFSVVWFIEWVLFFIVFFVLRDRPVKILHKVVKPLIRD